ncbi:MAG: DUF4430 domain-containing protein [Candidatus Roizmanbacteria bacterium]|nr:DUF4430 domain-containing protein [Candidatus Roizmanbacteria bacterium]
MNKKIFLFLGFLILCFSCAFIQYKKSVPVVKVPTTFTFSISQTVGTNKRAEQVRVGSTALHLLSSTHQVVTKGQKENAFVTAIDGYTADTEKREFWAFYVNGKQAEVGAGSYVIKNHDTIEWKIETY